MIQKLKLLWFQNMQCKHEQKKQIERHYFSNKRMHVRYGKECTNCKKEWLF